DFQSAASQNFILLADRTCQPTQIQKHQAPEKSEIRKPKLEGNSKTEKILTADCTDFTDVFDGHSQLKVAQIFNLPYRRISFCWPIGLANRHRFNSTKPQRNPKFENRNSKEIRKPKRF